MLYVDTQLFINRIVCYVSMYMYISRDLYIICIYIYTDTMYIFFERGCRGPTPDFCHRCSG